jgi:hypothetical protein
VSNIGEAGDGSGYGYGSGYGAGSGSGYKENTEILIK